MPQGVELCTDFPEGADKYITTDAVRLKQVLNNLINNAKKFTVQGSITLGYRVDESGYTTVFVEDTGAGISDEDQKHIFERFYRVDKSHSREIGGTGLGLAIARSAIVMHRGAIRVYSKENEGTTFSVRIPLNYVM